MNWKMIEAISKVLARSAICERDLNASWLESIGNVDKKAIADFVSFGRSEITTYAMLPDGKFHQVEVVKDGDIEKYYKNGKLVWWTGKEQEEEQAEIMKAAGEAKKTKNGGL